MIVTIHQPSYLPWIPFVEKGLQSDIFVLLDDVQFEKNSEQNRNRIKTAQGATWLSVPVTRSADTRITEVQIAAQPPGWNRKHRRSIEENYSRSPYFQAVAPPLFDILDNPPATLVDLNLAVSQLWLRLVGFAGQVIRSSTLGVTATSSARVVTICQALGATRYLSGRAGADYMQLDSFAAAGIEVLFQDYRHPAYPQMFPKLGFVPHLSAIDLFCNVGVGDTARESILAGSGWISVPQMLERRAAAEAADQASSHTP